MNREELIKEAKELGIDKGLGNAKPETIKAKIDAFKAKESEPADETIQTENKPLETQENPQVMMRGQNLKVNVVGFILKKNLMHNGRVYLAGQTCPDGLDMQSLASRGII